jgi:hypothetical protein
MNSGSDGEVQQIFTDACYPTFTRTEFSAAVCGMFPAVQ